MIWYLILLPLFIYVGLVLWFVKGWLEIRSALGEMKLEIEEQNKFLVSIIIPCRNESGNILRILNAIEQQNFDFKNLEVIVVDDHSTDDTLDKISNFISPKADQISNSKLLILMLNDTEFGKKAAIAKAISISKGEIIVCTDADCEFGENWLQSMTSVFNGAKIKMATGPVMFFEKPGFWNQLMQLEFLSLIGIGAGCIKNDFPTMCNGANIAYRKSAFIEVNGFEGNEHIPSGDDEFLMHKIFKKFKEGILFIRNPDAIVHTEPPQSFNEFINQRIRWGSKAGHYKSFKSKVLPAFMFCFNVLLFITPILFFLGMPWILIATLWFGKLAVEIVFFVAILPFFRSSKILDLVIPAQIFHVVYIAVIGVLSVLVSYKWKGRNKK